MNRTIQLVTGVVATVAISVALVGGGAPAGAADPSGTAGAAESYGLLVDATLLQGNVPVQEGPLAWSAQDAPPGAAQPNTNSVVQAGPVPADGSLVNHVGVMTTSARATTVPQATATAETADASLLSQAGVPLVSADVVRSQANADCATDPNATGTTFVNLSVNGTPITNTPAPNTVIDLTVAKVILNEQHPAADGRGIVVNGIHVLSTTTGAPLFSGDIIVSHAMASVNCTNGAGSTGGNSVLPITKTVTPDSVTPGSQVTYTVTITNKATADCLVNEAIDHLPPGFTVVSTSGDLGKTSTTRDRPGGASDVIVGTGTTIAHGKSATQTFVVKVGDKVAPGVYYNDVEVLCANLGDFVKGLDAPVEVTPVAALTSVTEAAPAPTLPARELPATGGGPTTAELLAAAAALALAVYLGRAARSSSRL